VRGITRELNSLEKRLYARALDEHLEVELKAKTI
jgi:hypothetical protein